jgi:Ca2+-binding EF-hand superfamily protein
MSLIELSGDSEPLFAAITEFPDELVTVHSLRAFSVGIGDELSDAGLLDALTALDINKDGRVDAADFRRLLAGKSIRP